METYKKVTINVYPEQERAIQRLRAKLEKESGPSSVSAAIRHAVLKAAKGLPK